MGNLQSSKRRVVSKEAEKYCKSTGLYSSCPWDQNTVRKWILDGKVAPRYPNIEDPDHRAVECPICFMSYQGVNTCVCCGKPLCTECYLQLRPPRSSVACPFCNSVRFSVKYSGPETVEQRNTRWTEEQKVIEAKINAAREQTLVQEQERAMRKSLQAQESLDLMNSGMPSTALAPPDTVNYSESLEYDSNNEIDCTMFPLATVDSRRALEAEMRLQHLENVNDNNASSLRQPVRRHRHGNRVILGETEGRQRSLEDLIESFGPPELYSAVSHGADTQQIEDAMLSEAIRLSLIEQSRQQSSSSINASISSLNSSSHHSNNSNSQMRSSRATSTNNWQRTGRPSLITRNSYDNGSMNMLSNRTRPSLLTSNSNSLMNMIPNSTRFYDSDATGDLQDDYRYSASESIPSSEMEQVLLAIAISMEGVQPENNNSRTILSSSERAFEPYPDMNFSQFLIPTETENHSESDQSHSNDSNFEQLALMVSQEDAYGSTSISGNSNLILSASVSSPRNSNLNLLTSTSGNSDFYLSTSSPGNSNSNLLSTSSPGNSNSNLLSTSSPGNSNSNLLSTSVAIPDVCDNDGEADAAGGGSAQKYHSD